MSNFSFNHLKEVLRQVDDAYGWLERSYKICQKIGLKTHYAPEEFDAFETLTSRYARLTDMVTHKLFRAIDAVELESGGTLIDVVNRAHKRGLIESPDDVRLLKDLRNSIAHEYITEDLEILFQDVFKKVPELIRLVKDTKQYCKSYSAS